MSDQITRPDGGAPQYKLGVDDYLRMTRMGIFDPDAPIELLDGILTPKSGRSHGHVYSGKSLLALLPPRLPAGWHVAKGDPIRTATSMLDPGISVLRGEADDYRDRHPDAHEVGIVVEIAEAANAFDRQGRRRIYGAAGIPAYWIVDLDGRRVEVHSGPNALPGYRRVRVYPLGHSIPLILDGTEVGRVAVADILP